MGRSLRVARLAGAWRVAFAVVAVASGVAYVKWRDAAIYNIPEASPNGFIPVVMPDGASTEAVLIFTPPDCPSKALNRARSLQEKLTGLGVPYVTTSSYALSDAGRHNEADIQRTKAVLEGTIPAVFVNGMARANPDFQQVAAEFERTRRRR